MASKKRRPARSGAKGKVKKKSSTARKKKAVKAKPAKATQARAKVAKRAPAKKRPAKSKRPSTPRKKSSGVGATLKSRMGAIADKARAVGRKALDRIASHSPATGAAASTAPTAGFGSPLLDEVIEEPLLDTSGVLRIKDQIARAQRDGDEDERKRFPDPSLVVKSQTQADASLARMPDLFKQEAIRQRERMSREAAAPKSQPTSPPSGSTHSDELTRDSDDSDDDG